VAVFGRLAEALFAQFNRVRVWHRMPTLPLRVLNLLLLRRGLRRLNLHDTQRGGFPKPEREIGPEVYRLGRTIDGTYNDLAVPAMGSRGMRFGRNSAIDKLKIPTQRDVMEPNPREVSRRLLARRNGEFYAVPYLNIFAAAWLQFMTHDWFGHHRDDQDPHVFNLTDDDDWPGASRSFKFGRSQPDKEAYTDRGLPPAFVNTESHWWDSGQVYGRDEARQDQLRTHSEGKLKVAANGRLESDGALELTGVNDNWWVGLSLLHTLFTHEHNAICDRLLSAYPARRNDDEWLYQKARLVNIAVIAKIHTVEWTPALLNNPTMRFAMRGNWWGAFGETFYRERGRITQGETFQGIPGSDTDHHAAPYSLTEEFVAVYRMHPLMPDVFDFRSLNDDSPIAGAEKLDFRGVSGKRTLDLYAKMSTADAAYSLGTRNPGQVRLRNYPSGLSNFERQDSVTGPASDDFFDLGTVDVVRDRERGVPRYNDFRRMLRMPPCNSIEEITSNKEWQAEIGAVYGGDVEKVDAIVGLLAEDLPEGFGFSDTAFRIFIVMASRRLKSDRFFTVDYTPEMYTPEGMDWINRTFMTDVFLRHLPALEPAMRGVKNAFFKWREAKPQ
jgi:hypothetical protein